MHSDCLLLRGDALIDGELNIAIKHTRFKNKITFADINTRPSSKQSQFSFLIKFFCTVISSGADTLLAVGESSIIQVVKMASHVAEHGGIRGANNRVLDAKMSCSCKEIADNILIMFTATGIKTTPTNISDVSNSKIRETMQC